MPKNADRPDADTPEWTRNEIRESRPLLDVLPDETAAVVRRRGQPRTPASPVDSLLSPAPRAHEHDLAARGESG